MGDTLSGETQISDATKSQALTVTGGAVRSTVLPRVEWNGPDAKVNPSQRNRFEELGLLGEGGMGEVVLAQDHETTVQPSPREVQQDRIDLYPVPFTPSPVEGRAETVCGG